MSRLRIPARTLVSLLALLVFFVDVAFLMYRLL